MGAAGSGSMDRKACAGNGKLISMNSSPLVTVLMSVFNGEKFLRVAIDSILDQVYDNFEFLIIDDASTDGSGALIYSYRDPRIRCIRNEQNLGLTASLNKGIPLARGEFVARMDADDISSKDRLSQQVSFLDANPTCAAIAGRIIFIDGYGTETGSWNDDQAATTSHLIRHYLPKANCLAHPAMMIRKHILEHYRYNEKHLVSQDYELWLRMCADGLVIEKLQDVVLQYRIHAESITEQSKKGISEIKNIRTKSFFLTDRLLSGRINKFTILVFGYLFRDIFYYAAKRLLKRQ
jgi:glycosyltransferase involved in cell wall biosynthesis